MLGGRPLLRPCRLCIAAERRALGFDAPARWVRAHSTATFGAAPNGATIQSRRPLDRCVRLTDLFAPTVRAEALSPSESAIPSVALLLRGGFIRRSSAGVYTLLPLGLRVVRKISDLVEEEMDVIGASRLEMPTLLSSRAWKRSGRWDSMNSELFKLPVRGGSSEYLLGPTHEEEVTQLVDGEVSSHKQLPVKVYQITRKFRNEPRPKSGMLRTREFYMKDLYTFDSDVSAAKAAYEQVRHAYGRIFDRLLGQHHGPWLSAAADTGAIGGQLSHEYHLADSLGEDTLLSCASCGSAENQELARSAPSTAAGAAPVDSDDLQVQLFEMEAPPDRGAVIGSTGSPGTLFAVVTARDRVPSAPHLSKVIGRLAGRSGAIKAVGHDSACFQPEQFQQHFDRIHMLVDQACISVEQEEVVEAVMRAVTQGLHREDDAGGAARLQLTDIFPPSSAFEGSGDSAKLEHKSSIALDYDNIKQAVAGDDCLVCAQRGKRSPLTATQSIEIGHTFLLGTKYSLALNAGFTPAPDQQDVQGGKAPFQMGCYGIGISRLLGAIASRAASLGDGEQLIWPRSIAPFQLCIIVPAASSQPGSKVESTLRSIVSAVLQQGAGSPAWAGTKLILPRDIAIDDRNLSISRKLKDADLIGFPVVLVLGRAWKQDGQVEVIVRDAQAASDRAEGGSSEHRFRRDISLWQL